MVVPTDVAVSTPASVTLDAFLTALAQRLNIRDTAFYRNFIRRWIHFESGDTIGAAFNPLNTTLNYGSYTLFNDVGVKNYADLSTGVEATARTLEESPYSGILTALREENFIGHWWDIIKGLRLWGTGQIDGAYAFADELALLTANGFKRLPELPTSYPDPRTTILGIHVPNVGLPGLPGIHVPNVDLPGLPGINVPNVGLPGLPGIPDVVTNPIGDVTSAVWTGIKALTNPANWLRVFLIIAGAALILTGIALYVSSSRAGSTIVRAASRGVIQ